MNSHDNIHNAAVATLGGMPAWFGVFVEANTVTILSAVILPCVFFILGKTVDIVFRLYVEKKKKGSNDEWKGLK